MLERLWATAIMEDRESIHLLCDLLWNRYFTVCQARLTAIKLKRRARRKRKARRSIDADFEVVWGASSRAAECTPPADSIPQASAPCDVMFRHHTQLLASTYYFQNEQVRRALLSEHLGLVRRVGAMVVVEMEESALGGKIPSRGLALLLSQSIALAEFMLRTVHDSERSVALAARLRSDVARVPHVPSSAHPSAPGSARSEYGSSGGSLSDQCVRFQTVFEADEEVGFAAWHERPGAARVSIRSLWSETSPGCCLGWREAWMSFLKVAAANSQRSEDAVCLFFCAWRSLGMLPPEQVVASGVGNVAEPPEWGFARLEADVRGMARLRSCLLGLQSSSTQWGFFSPTFSATLSMVREGLPGWFGLEPKALAEAMVHTGAPGSAVAATGGEILRHQLRVLGLVEVFTVYARAAIAAAAVHKQQERGSLNSAVTFTSVGGQRLPTASHGPDVRNIPLVSLSVGITELAEECFRNYHRTIEVALTALHAVGGSRKPGRFGDRYVSSEEVSSAPASDTGEGDGKNIIKSGGDADRVAAPPVSKIPAELAVPIALRVHCHMLSSVVSRLSSLGFDHYLVGGLYAEINYRGDESAPPSHLPTWLGQACARSTSRTSQTSGKLSPSYAEPDELLGRTEEGSRRRDGGPRGKTGHRTRKWEVMVNNAVWKSLALSRMLWVPGDDAEAEPALKDSGKLSDRAPPSAQDVDVVLESAVKTCLSARAALNGALLGLAGLIDALAWAGNITKVPPAAQQGPLPSPHGGVVDERRSAASEAWSQISLRAAALFGDVSTHPWCKWFSPLCGRAFDKLVLPVEAGGIGVSTTDDEREQEKARNALDLWTTVAGARQVRRADSLIRLALDGFRVSGQGAEEDGDRGDGGGDSCRAPVPEPPRVCVEVALEEGLEQVLAMLATPHTAADVCRFFCGAADTSDFQMGASPQGLKVAEAIAAVVPSRSPTSGRGEHMRPDEDPRATEAGAVGVDPLGHSSLSLVPTGDMRTLISLVKRAEFSTFVPKALQVLRTALEAEARSFTPPTGESSTDQRLKPMTDAVTSALHGWPEESLQELVAGATAPRSHEASGHARDTADALYVLSVAVGFPGVGGRVVTALQQDILRKRFLNALLESASSWVGRRTGTYSASPILRRGEGSGVKSRVDSGKIRASADTVDLASLSLWMANKEGMFAELAVAVTSVAHGYAEELQARRRTEEGAQPEMDDKQAEEEEVTGSLTRCLELMVTILRPFPSVAVKDEESEIDEDDTDKIDSEFAGRVAVGSDGEHSWESGSVGRTGSARDAVLPHAVGASRAAVVGDEPPLVCTFVSSPKQYVNQHWYHCYTCNLVHDKGCCRLCVRLCHRGHDVSYARLSCFFCDCGSAAAEGDGEDCDAAAVSSSGGGARSGASSTTSGAVSGVTSPMGGSTQDSGRVKCDCLKPRTRRELNALLRPASASALVPNARGRSRGGRHGEKKQHRRTSAATGPTTAARATVSTAAVAEQRAVQWRKSASQVASMSLGLFGNGTSSGILDDLLEVYSTLLTRFDAAHECGELDCAGFGDYRARCRGGGGGPGAATGSNQWTALCDAMKSAVVVAPPSSRSPAAHSILAPARLVKNGSLDVRLPTNGVQAKRDRSAMALHGVVRCNLAATSCGKIAVAEAQKVLIVDPVGALALRYARAPADAPVDRSVVCVLSTTAVGFDVIGLAFNPANERHLVVWGLRQCCVIVLDSRGVALRRVQVCVGRKR